MRRTVYSLIPTSVRISVPAPSAEEAEALTARLEDETHDLDSLARLGVRIEEISFGAHSDAELFGQDESNAGSAESQTP